MSIVISLSLEEGKARGLGGSQKINRPKLPTLTVLCLVSQGCASGFGLNRSLNVRCNFPTRHLVPFSLPSNCPSSSSSCSRNFRTLPSPSPSPSPSQPHASLWVTNCIWRAWSVGFSLGRPCKMVQLKEFRIVMPMSLEEYQIAQMYTVTKMQLQSRTDTEGVDILESRPFEDSEFGKGHYTSKVYRLQSKVPAWLTTFAPADALIIQEEAWNAYPRCKTVLKCPYFTKFSLTIDTIHKADNGQSENVHGLSEEQLATRQVETIDIASATTDYWSYAIARSDVDFSKFNSVRTGRGPLSEGWQSKCNPVMTAYKLVTIDAPYWGFGYRLEQAMLSGERALFIESHRNCFSWIDDWFGMTIQKVRELERCLLPERIANPTTLKSVKEHEMRFPINSEDIHSERPQLKSDRRPIPVEQES